MDFTQVRGFVVGISFGLPRSISSVTCFELSRRGHRAKQFFKLLKVARLSEPRIWQTSAGTAELLCCLT